MEKETNSNYKKSSTNEYQSCTSRKCFFDRTENNTPTLKCWKCHRKVHYVCSDLPVYQIQLCLIIPTRRFQCMNCVSISKELMEIFNKAINNAPNHAKEPLEDAKKANDVDDIKESLKDLCYKVKDLEIKTKETLKEIKEATQIKAQEMTKESKITYADLIKNETIPNTTKNVNKEKIKEHARQDSTRLSNNLIMHNVKENKINSDEEKNYDQEFIHNFIKYLGLDMPVKVCRIGTASSNKQRPLKVMFESENEKNLLLKNLWRLKNSKYDDVSVKEDLTVEERELVKRWVVIAKKKNNALWQPSNFKWVVRGNPRTGLYFKTIQIL